MTDVYDGDDIEWFREALKKADITVVRLQDEVAGLKAQLAEAREVIDAQAIREADVRAQCIEQEERANNAEAEVERLRGQVAALRAVVEDCAAEQDMLSVGLVEAIDHVLDDTEAAAREVMARAWDEGAYEMGREGSGQPNPYRAPKSTTGEADHD